MKKIGYHLFGVAVGLLLFIANIASASACAWGHYQPEVPEPLRK
ncbi:MAG: cyclic lactone autoinducer peptide [Firmicutes bacterium]|nr:cyclic lactone autoinducer peptide [Bacillota bacterium]